MIEFTALLVVATLFGGMMIYSFGFAPLVFSALPADQAGRFIRAAFPWYYLFVIATAALAGMILLPRDTGSGAIMIVIVAIGLYARQLLMPRINAARDSQLQGDAAAKRSFGRLHALSVALNLVQLVLAAYVLYRFL
jgi:hypothetical protein